MLSLSLDSIVFTKYLFFTGKGGVGKTSVACAVAVGLADAGKNVLLVSTDPASNLQDVFHTDISNKGIALEEVPNLVVANLDPIQAAAEYRESVVGPYRGKLPESVITNMEEQLSGSCTVEIAAFNEFSKYLTESDVAQAYDHIIFDTAPTGHTLRMLQLPSAWSGFIETSTHGASCLGQLAGLEEKKEVYGHAVATLSDAALTTLVLVSRPEQTPLKEAAKASSELSELGAKNQFLIINGLLADYDDSVSEAFSLKQQRALADAPKALSTLATYYVPLRSYNVLGLANIRALLTADAVDSRKFTLEAGEISRLSAVVDDLVRNERKVIFTMGKGGVGKTTVAAAIALNLVARGKKVHLATTDPAAHLKFVVEEGASLTMSRIDEQAELARYRVEVLDKARETMSKDDLAYIEEDLRSPCTQEIAVFRAFAEIVEKASDRIVVIDTAPTGHTLLLLDSTQSYSHEVERTQGEVPESVARLLPRLRSEETEVIIVTLPEATPVFEALRLEEDLRRADITTKWWVINSSLYLANSTNALLSAKAQHEIEWIDEVARHTDGNFAVIAWSPDEIKGEKLLEL
ncbi:MAG: arsenical pump-driving ATPase [Coriobacteriia bacterium]|nr:arsenical pump-driving ATPase [Coriobacteriia bacterium]